MKWTKRIVTLLAAIALLALFTWAFMPEPVPVQVAEVTRGHFQQIVEEDGKTRVRERYVVSAPVTGKLQRITLKAGDAVKQDQVVALVLPSPPALLDVRSERELTERVGAAEAQKERTAAEVARAMATLEKSRADLNRATKLAAGRFISPAQLDQSELEVKISTRELQAAQHADHAAAHEIAVARAALKQFHCDEDCESPDKRHWQVRAPISGRVLKVTQENEAEVTAGAPLLEIGDPADLEVVVDVLSTDAVDIHPGADVEMKGWDQSTPLKGRVRLVEPSAFTKLSALGVEEQRVNVIIDFTSPVQQWKNLGDGYRVDAKIIVFSRENTVKIPVSALFRRDNQWAVYVVANGRAHEHPIQLARRGGLEAMIESGLQPGEKVIVYPGDLVKDGVKVTVK